MDEQTQKKLLNRLRRIEGQVKGLQKMVSEEKYCIDIITQTQAITSALDAFETAMLKNHLETHVVEQMRSGQEGTAIGEILKVYQVSQRRK